MNATMGREPETMQNGRQWSLLILTNIDQPLEGSSGMLLGKKNIYFAEELLTHHSLDSTVLSSAGNDGRVRLWKATVGNVWRSAGSLGVEQTEEATSAGESRDVDMDT